MMREAVAFLKAHDDLLLIAHISPDGDTLGSSLALYCGLKRLGKTVRVVCENPVPASYRFCPYADRVLLPEQAEPAKTVVAVDCADLLRTGACARFFETAEASLCIDHHETNRGFADVNWVSCVAATGELIYQLLVELEVPIDVEIATLLYTALAADTGNFAYSNTTADTFRIAAELRETGFDLPEINRLLFRTFSFAKLKLLGNHYAVGIVIGACNIPFAVTLMRTFFLNVPKELEEQARIDGAGNWQVMIRIILPLVSPGIITVATIVALNTWNEYLLTSTFLIGNENFTATMGMLSLVSANLTDPGTNLAGAMLLIGPILAIFLMLQKYFIEGTVNGSVKG